MNIRIFTMLLFLLILPMIGFAITANSENKKIAQQQTQVIDLAGIGTSPSRG